MTALFSVRIDTHFERLVRSMRARHPDFDAQYIEAIQILKADPHNLGSRYAIKKLKGARQGDGQYRLRLRRWRFRYDVYGQDVVLTYCGLRREDTYR